MSNILPLYLKVFTDKLDLNYINQVSLIKAKLFNNIKSNGSFSLTLNPWTAINQDAFLGITL